MAPTFGSNADSDLQRKPVKSFAIKIPIRNQKTSTKLDGRVRLAASLGSKPNGFLNCCNLKLMFLSFLKTLHDQAALLLFDVFYRKAFRSERTANDKPIREHSMTKSFCIMLI